MRDPNRIFEITATVSDKWYTTCPDWRFMQLMSNFVAWLGHDPFYMEDSEFCNKFCEFIETLR